jgi:hypothetical protein
MSKIRLTIFILLSVAILASLIWGLHLGHPQDIQMEASTL